MMTVSSVKKRAISSADSMPTGRPSCTRHPMNAVLPHQARDFFHRMRRCHDDWVPAHDREDLDHLRRAMRCHALHHEVAVRNHAYDSIAVTDRQGANAEKGHDLRGFLCGSRLLDRVRGLGHDVENLHDRLLSLRSPRRVEVSAAETRSLPSSHCGTSDHRRLVDADDPNRTHDLAAWAAHRARGGSSRRTSTMDGLLWHAHT